MSEPKKLKLGFAMGGGVSLGSFCGSALTESIKLALLFGHDTNQVPFEHVEIDVFVGASAGAMSLGIMLKSLAFPCKDTAIRERAENHIKAYYHIDNSTWASFSHAKRQQLIDTQCAQDVMNEIWVNQITLKKLLDKEGDGKRIPPLKYQCGLLNKRAVTDIAKTHLLPEGGYYQQSDRATNPILADRVLFGCSLASLNPIQANAHDLYPLARGANISSNDALSSYHAREVRVFDINFTTVDSDKLDENDRHPQRWVRLHWGDSIEGKTFDIRKAKDWKHIVATAVASGCFPMAFEPVTLTRYKWEFTENTWPFGAAQSNANLTYVDGGAFNNEPVSEAFRLASHIDGADEGGSYERRIIFVDPNVGGQPSFNLPGLQDWQTQNAFKGLLKPFNVFDGQDLIRKTSLDKLTQQAAALLTMISRQAESKEEHKTFQVANTLVMRNRLREMIGLGIEPTKERFLALKGELGELLKQFNKKSKIPTLPSTLEGELKRLALEKDSLFSDLYNQAGAIVAAQELAQFNRTTQKKIMSALVFSYIDIISGLAAKSRNSQLIAIGPFYHAGAKFEKVFLPGSPLAGFAGFTSTIPSNFEVDAAKRSTFDFMRHSELIKSDRYRPPSITPFNRRHPNYYEYMVDFKQGLTLLGNRVDQIIEQSHLLNAGLLNKPVLSWIASKIRETILNIDYEQPDSVCLEFRIPVSDEKFEFDGKNKGDDDRHPVRLVEYGNALYLIGFATWDWNKKTWRGYNVDNGEIQIDRDGFAFWADENSYYSITLPNVESIKKAQLLAYPVFVGNHVLEEKEGERPVISSNYWRLENGVAPLTDLL